ncbi:MAG: hypothetical protein KatS3mg035_1207 [Bacteroidia bacterium]|nr:MAG: hypothetical protein KatS3mg035_1207 [Bacteroidia bacterium]
MIIFVSSKHFFFLLRIIGNLAYSPKYSFKIEKLKYDGSGLYFETLQF